MRVINTKFGRHTVHGSRSTSVNLEVKGQGHAVTKCAAGVGMHVDRTVRVLYSYFAPGRRANYSDECLSLCPFA